MANSIFDIPIPAEAPMELTQISNDWRLKDTFMNAPRVLLRALPSFELGNEKRRNST